MTNDSDFSNLVLDFFNTLDLPAEATPGDDVYTLGVDETLDLHITHNGQGHIVLLAKVGDISEFGYATQKYQWLLSQYQVGSPDACHIHLADGEVIYWRSIAMAGLETQQLIAQVESFSSTSLNAQLNLNAQKPSADEYEAMPSHMIDELPPWAVRG